MQFTRQNVAGIVINGAIRDAAYIRDQAIPVFAAGVTHRGPYKNGPGEINVPSPSTAWSSPPETS